MYHDFLQHLQNERSPFVLRRKEPGPRFADAVLHRVAYARDPEFYALHGLAPGVQPGQAARVLYTLLRSDRRGMSQRVVSILDRCARQLFKSLPLEQVWPVMLSLRRTRCNRRHARRLMLEFLLDHPQLEQLVLSRRPTLVDCLEHAFGRDRFRLFLNSTKEPVTEQLLRHAKDRLRVQSTLRGLKRRLPAPVREAVNQAEVQSPVTVTASNRGAISEVLVRRYRGAVDAALHQQLERLVYEQATKLPQYHGRLALVLDASPSMAGFGERQHCLLAQAVALTRVWQQAMDGVRVVQVGGQGNLPRACGHTDLATALLDALELQPELVAILSDGYENRQQHDLADVVTAVRRIGITTPVVFCHTKFSPGDDLVERRPAPQLPELEFWHQSEFERLTYNLLSRVQGAESTLKQHLLGKLEILEKEEKQLCIA